VQKDHEKIAASAEEIPAVVLQEESRLAKVLKTVELYEQDRKAQHQRHQAGINSLKAQRLDSLNWAEKNSLTEKIRDKEVYDPGKYLPPFSQGHAPYFASFTILDEDPKIGRQEYLLGKQSLFSDNKVLIVDWRQAAISALYYEYEPDEEYDEDINGRERLGILAEKRRYTIKASELLRCEISDGEIYEKQQGKWRDSAKSQSTSQVKEEAGNHHLVDIVSLISPDQFGMITREYHGCLRIQGSAGAGKTTIALHRLSFLLFNYPEKFRPKRCMVLMFNRALRNYVSASAKDMLGPETQVDTFHSWAAKAFRALGLKKITFSAKLPSEFDAVKKNSAMAALVKEYALTAGDAVAVEHLICLYSSEELLQKHLADQLDSDLLKRFLAYYQGLRQRREFDSAIGFSDVGILLRLLQIRLTAREPGTENHALNYFDHLVIDEAQDFSQVELECLFNAATSARSLTICADPNQQILTFVDADGLENFSLDLQEKGVSDEQLKISYRSTMEIMTLANSVLGKGPGNGKRHGEPVYCRQHPDRDEAITDLQRLALQEQEKAPNGLLAIICKHKGEVEQIYKQLRSIRGVRKEPQRFQPGILIINCHQVKGLEFTSVILWNASAKSYRLNSRTDRNLLYVSLSRACDRLAVLCHEPPTPYLADCFSA